MKLVKIKSTEFSGKAKATIHKSGKLGFSKEAIEYMKIDSDSFILFFKNEEDKDDSNLYASVVKDEEDSFKISKAGEYFFVNTKALFDNQNVDYVNKKYIYDIVKIDYEEGSVYKFVRRELKKKEINKSCS